MRKKIINWYDQFCLRALIFFNKRFVRSRNRRAIEEAVRIWTNNYERWRERLPVLEQTYNDTERQKRCRHLKGGGYGLSTIGRDYNISYHRFINNRARIRCLTCGKVWWENEPGWKEALEMMNQSSNTPSSSEIPGEMRQILKDGQNDNSRI